MNADPSMRDMDETVRRELNVQEQQEAMEQAQEFRRAVLVSAHRSLLAFLRLDQIAFARARHPSTEQSTVEQYVAVTSLTAPTEGGEPINCMSLRFEKDPTSDQTRSDSMTLYFPNPPDFNIMTTDPDLLPVPDTIFVERVDENKKTWRCAIGTDRAYYYRTDLDHPEGQVVEGEGWDDFTVESVKKRVDNRVPVMSAIKEDIANMRVVCQVTIPVPPLDSSAVE